MKNLKFFLFLFVILAFCFSSCEKEDKEKDDSDTYDSLVLGAWLVGETPSLIAVPETSQDEFDLIYAALISAEVQTTSLSAPKKASDLPAELNDLPFGIMFSNSGYKYMQSTTEFDLNERQYLLKDDVLTLQSPEEDDVVLTIFSMDKENAVVEKDFITMEEIQIRVNEYLEDYDAFSQEYLIAQMALSTLQQAGFEKAKMRISLTKLNL